VWFKLFLLVAASVRTFSLESVESFLLFGSNLGDRDGFLRKGFDMVSHLQESKIMTASGIYETEPVEVTDQPLFLNVAARISTSLTPVKLLAKLKEIEAMVGRIARGRWREREIDIDIIFYGKEELESNELTIPHPKAHLRRFVLQPLNEIAPDYVHPIFLKTVSRLLRECQDTSSVVRIGEPLFLAG
jgi:2-amino-4-hydroxy-6-hydroxymethyldihydropteridine diphosphokinase